MSEFTKEELLCKKNIVQSFHNYLEELNPEEYGEIVKRFILNPGGPLYELFPVEKTQPPSKDVT